MSISMMRVRLDQVKDEGVIDVKGKGAHIPRPFTSIRNAHSPRTAMNRAFSTSKQRPLACIECKVINAI